MKNFYLTEQSKNILATKPCLVEVNEKTNQGVETSLLLLAKLGSELKTIAYINMYNKNNIRYVGEVFANKDIGKLIYAFALMKANEDNTGLTREREGNTEEAALNIWRNIDMLDNVKSRNVAEDAFSWCLCDHYFDDMMRINNIPENKHGHYFDLLKNNFKKASHELKFDASNKVYSAEKDNYYAACKKNGDALNLSQDALISLKKDGNREFFKRFDFIDGDEYRYSDEILMMTDIIYQHHVQSTLCDLSY